MFLLGRPLNQADKRSWVTGIERAVSGGKVWNIDGVLKLACIIWILGQDACYSFVADDVFGYFGPRFLHTHNSAPTVDNGARNHRTNFRLDDNVWTTLIHLIGKDIGHAENISFGEEVDDPITSPVWILLDFHRVRQQIHRNTTSRFNHNAVDEKSWRGLLFNSRHFGLVK